MDNQKINSLPKALTLGNGNMLVNMDTSGQVRDFYFPFVGQENHVGGHCLHSIGVYVDGVLTWISDNDWVVKMDCESETFTGKILAVNKKLELELKFTDIVYNEKNVFIRRVIVHNNTKIERKIKIFFYQQFELYESHTAHTAYFDPRNNSIIHYRNKRAFLIGGQLEGRVFDDFTTGIFGSEGKEGSFVDAVDGNLAQNPIEHGNADSAIGFTSVYRPGEEKFLYYWIAAAFSVDEAIELDHYIAHKGPGYLIKTTQDFWHAWVNRQNFSFHGLSPEIVSLFNKSLFYVRAHADDGGGIVASGDSSMLHKGKDTYAYVWPRDAAYCSRALDRAGDFNITQRFFKFCNEVITPDGYFMHKYSPDKSLGSSWHGWLYEGNFQLPIQEDETATVLFVLWEHYKSSKDLEFIESIYNSLIKPVGDFLVTFRDEETRLPKSSFGLWEEHFGVHTYTTSAVYGALVAAANFAKLLGKVKSESRYIRAAREIKESILKHLYDENSGLFYKMIKKDKEGQFVVDATPDMASFFGIFNFGVLEAGDEKLIKMVDIMKKEVIPDPSVGGFCRYKDDKYYKSDNAEFSNAWFITTFWYAQWLIAKAKNEKDLDEVKAILEWAVDKAQVTGVMSEQLDGKTGQQLSAGPLAWSHAEYITTVVKYLDKLEDFGICKTCNPVY